MFKSVPLWLFLVCLLLGALLTVAFGWAVKSTLQGSDRSGVFGEIAVSIASLPSVANRLVARPTDTTARVEKVQFESIFVGLSGEQSARLPVARRGTGGGLTSFGDKVLVLTHEGKIYTATSASDVRITSIETPDNGYAAYARAAESDKYKDFDHSLRQFRYNDILHFRSDSRQGLALSYTEYDEAGECYQTAIAVLTIDPDVRSPDDVVARSDDWDVVYRTQPCMPLKPQYKAIEGHMAGGRIAFKDDPETVYLASGDYSLDGIYSTDVVAQDIDKHYGKVIAIDLRSSRARVVSKGHRNPQGIAFDASGELWVAEHGMRGGDELNRIVEDADYGWPQETLGTRYNLLPAPNVRSYGRHLVFRAPTFAWLPSVATSNITLIEGFHESWDGDLLMATLKDRSLYRIRVRDERVLFAERIFIDERIRYAHQHSDGRIVLWTDSANLIFLRAAEQGFVAQYADQFIAKADYDDVRRNQIRTALDSCMKCHSLEPDRNAGAPSLAATADAPVASTEYDGYTEALKEVGGRWSRANLAAFFQDPQAYAPGTAMPNPGVDDPRVVDGLIDVLEAISKNP